MTFLLCPDTKGIKPPNPTPYSFGISVRGPYCKLRRSVQWAVVEIAGGKGLSFQSGRGMRRQ